MADYFRGLLTPPVFQKEGTTRQAGLLYRWSQNLFTPVLVSGILHHTLGQQPGPILWLYLSVCLDYLLVMALTRQGWIRVATFIFPFSIWLAITIGIVLSGQILTPIFSLYIPVVVSAGLLQGARVGYIYGVASTLVGLLIFLGEVSGLLPIPLMVVGSFETFLIFILGIGSTVMIMESGVSILRNTLMDAEITSQLLRESEKVLRHSVKFAPGHIFYLNRQGQVLHIDDSDNVKSVNVSIYDGIDPKDFTLFNTELERCFSDRMTRQFMVRNVERECIYRVWLSPVRSSAGPSLYCVGNIYIHTQEKEAPRIDMSDPGQG